MIISLNDEYRKMLVSVLSEYDNLDVDMVNDILASWDAKVNEMSDTLVPIVGAVAKKSRKGAKQTGPKRPMSAYLFFCKEKRAEIKEENPSMKATEVTSELGRLWHQVKETDEVEQYNELAKADKERYAAEMVDAPPKEPKEKKERKKKATVESSDGESKEEKPKKKRAKKAKKSGPKKPKSAYLYFCEEKRGEVKEANPEMKPTEITAELGRLWNKIKDTPKANKYKEQSEDAKVQYAELVEAEKSRVPSSEDEAKEEEEEVPKAKKGKKLPKAKKEKVPTTGYQLFCSEEGEGIEKKELRKMWLEMKRSDMAKFQDYEVRAAEMKSKPTEEESEEEEVAEAKVEETETVVLPKMSLNQTQEPEAKAEAEDDLEDEEEAPQVEEEEEEDPSLVDSRTLLNYLDEIKSNRPKKDEFLEQVESLENLPSEIKEYIEKVRKLRSATITITVVEKLIVMCKDTIKSYEL
jgi:hypothetical protein